MENKKKKMFLRRYVTLIEMMIVMFLIALITGVVAYNYRGTLDEGKAFKTKAGMEKLATILNLAVADDPELLNSISNWQSVIEHSPLVQNPASLMRDGWGQLYVVAVDANSQIEISSPKYDEYLKTHRTMFNKN